ncbi:hypothetical protein J7643_18595 [bacterium]|nr:hypothetical protein [bacterium]
MPKPKTFQRRLKSQAEILSAFVSAFGRTLIARNQQALDHERLAEIAEGAMRIWAHNVCLYFDDDVVLRLKDFVADLQVQDPATPFIPELKDSYVIHIREGQIRLSAASLEALLSRYILPAAGSPLKDARLSLSGDRLILRAKVRKFGLEVPITMESEVSVGSEGMIELLPQRLAVSQVGIGGMIKLFNLELDRLLEMPADALLSVSGNQITIDPAGIFPSPRAIGRPTAVRIERGELVLSYSSPTPSEAAPLLDPHAPNYMVCMGHDLLVGKMMMHDAHFQIVNQEPAAHLDFSLDHYRSQLAAGSSSLHAGDQLLVRLPNLKPTKRGGTAPL